MSTPGWQKNLQNEPRDPENRSRHALPFRPKTSSQLPEPIMAKEQRASKNTKKPKKDAMPPKAAGSDRPTPPVTGVLPKGKLKNKPA
jgi:hypothetical protein